MGNEESIPTRAKPLHYAPAFLPRSKVKPPLGLAFAATLLNYFTVCAVVAWSGFVIERIVASNGWNVVWSSPKLPDFEHQAIEVPAEVGFGCTIVLTGLFTIILIRRGSGFWLIGVFILINLFAIIFMAISLEMGGIEHGLYP